MAPNLELLFSKYFRGTHGISLQIFLIDPIFLTGWLQLQTKGNSSNFYLESPVDYRSFRGKAEVFRDDATVLKRHLFKFS